jgi:hypothetical protein
MVTSVALAVRVPLASNTPANRAAIMLFISSLPY